MPELVPPAPELAEELPIGPEVVPAPGLRRAGIASIGTAVPERRVPNSEIVAELGVDEAWLFSRTGIRERRLARPGETLVDLLAAAAGPALDAAGLEGAELDLVLVASFTQDDLLPNAAPLLAGRLGAPGAGAIDLGAACTGFLAGLSLAAAQIEAGRCHHALVVGGDLLSRVTDYTDRRTAGLFGDGAGAAVISPGGGGAIGRIVMRSDAEGADCIRAGWDERLIRMKGQDTFRAAVDQLSSATLEVLEAEGLGLGDVDLFVYHQANARITRALGERLGLEPDRVVDCIADYGNTSAATLPIALSEAVSEGRIEPGARVLLGTFAAGFVWGAGLLEWERPVLV